MSEERRDELSLDEGPVVLTWPRELGRESFHDFAYWLIRLYSRAKHLAAVDNVSFEFERCSKCVRERCEDEARGRAIREGKEAKDAQYRREMAAASLERGD